MTLNSLLEQGVTIVTASRRLAHAVRLEFSREAQEQGRSVWLTPPALPWSAWLRQQYLDYRASQQQTSCSRLLSPAQTRVLWDEIVGSSQQAADLLNPSSAARLAARSWRRLHEYLIPVDRLSEFNTAESQALHAWCNEFLRRCTALDAIDDVRLTDWAFDSGLTPDVPLAFAGFDTMPPALIRLVDRWREVGKVRDKQSPEASNARISLVAAADLEAEIDLAARWARDRVSSGFGNVGVVIPDLQARREEVHEVFEDVLAPGLRQTGSAAPSLPVAIAAPSPLSSYPLVDAAMLLLQLAVGDAPSTLAGRILRSPFIKGGEVEAAARAHADFRLREEQRERWDWPKLERWAAASACEQLGLAARQLNAVLRQFPSSTSASEWAEHFHALWLSAGWPGDRVLSSVEHQTLEKFQDVLAEFGALGVVAGKLNLRRAVRRLQDLATDTQFEAETASAPITVIDPATSAGMKFDALWVTGLHADRWPAGINPDPLIPLELQRNAGLPEASANGMLRQATTQLQRWTTAAPIVVLSWPERDGDIELLRSPLLAQLELRDDVALPLEQTLPLRHVAFNERPALEVLQDDRAPALSTQSARGGARTLELQSRCPFRAQAELRLRAPRMPRVSLGVEPVDRGAILHRVLEDIWGSLRTQEALLNIDDVALEPRVRESAQRHAVRALLPDTPHRARLVALEIDSVVKLIMRLLRVERLRPAFSVQVAEAAEQYRIGFLLVTLRPDRIDLLDGGGQLLIDYKLGDAHRPRDWVDVWPGRPRRPQLPLYGLAHAESLKGLAYAVLAPGAVEYRGWSDGTPIGTGVLPYPAGIRIDLGDPGDWEALLHHWRFTLTRLAEQYVSGDARVDPLPQECATCHLSVLCRINEKTADNPVVEAANDDE